MADTSYKFVKTNEFTPNPANPSDPAQRWQTIGDIVTYSQNSNTFALKTATRPGPVISFLSKTAFRVRFSPDPGFDYSQDKSYAVVTQDLRSKEEQDANQQLSLAVQDTDEALIIKTEVLTVKIKKKPYAILVYRGTQLIHQDQPDYNLVYLDGQKVIANFKVYPSTAKYCGLGEKAGINLLKNEFTLTYFNYDNFKYGGGANNPGPLNPSVPLYASIPFLIENNLNPEGDYAGSPYSYGIFFDNPSQAFINIGTNDYSDMRGKYYFGALYGEMNYYFMAGDHSGEVLQQYTTLTGRSPMPPKYVFGFHQGGYGYYSRYLLSIVANSYRAARIPIDGLHIDVDFQDNYRTFTHSELKFPNAREMFDSLHSMGFKCSTNITPLLTLNPLDQNSEVTPYEQLNAIATAGGLLYDLRAGDPFPSDSEVDLYIGEVGYGENLGSNPFPSPGRLPNEKGITPLGAPGYYPNFELPEVQQVWGEQYRHLIEDLGMDMIWQDMTDPAQKGDDPRYPNKTFPLNLLQFNGEKYVPHGVIHNGYALNLLKSTFEGVDKLRPDKRNFIIARGGYAGMQRYAGLWTGDSGSSWQFLQINIPEVLNIGLSGVPISGCDIGGFAEGNQFENGNGSSPPGNPQVQGGKVIGQVTSPELLTRWMHLGAFLPWYRNHYNGYTKQFQEVYAYGEPVISNCRKYVELRYRLLQVFYDAMYEWTQTGMPIARALFLNEPTDSGIYGFSDAQGIFGKRYFVDDEFFLGKDLLIAPIVTPFNAQNGTVRKIYLPASSQWYSFKNNQSRLEPPVNGGTVINNYYADLSLVPIYVRAGAILPMRELEQYVGELPENPLTINIYPGLDGSYLLYQDDGITTEATSSTAAYRTTRISHQTKPDKSKQITLKREHDLYQPPEKFYYIALLETNAKAVTINGSTALPYLNQPGKTSGQLAALLAASPVDACYWNSDINITFIKVFDTQSEVTIVAS
ncbi:DUF4968 domain-containing protein [Desmonostoc muscorum CCALA 125]|nr:DUF4968 domain-containing protein [Desmonostoc muscorum CCALA 125]